MKTAYDDLDDVEKYAVISTMPTHAYREWDPEHKKMGKGITLSKDEIEKQKELLFSVK